MKTPTELPRRTGLARLAAGALVAIGVSLAAASPAAADDDRWDGHRHWKNQGHYYHPGYFPPGHYKHHKYKRPKVVYYPQPVYVAPPPPVYYYQPAPVYYGRPNVSIVFPIDLD